MAPFLTLLFVAFIVSCVILSVYRSFFGKQISFNKIMFFGLIAAFSVVVVFYLLDMLINNS